MNQRLEEANARLKPIKIQILSRGDRLSIRATLPKKSGTGKAQQTIALGLPCSLSGIKRAETIARKIASDRDLGLFRWEDYQKGKESISPLAEAIEKFKNFYLDRGGNLSTWTSEYDRFYRELKGLTQEDFVAVITTTAPNTRIRKKAVVACNALSKYHLLGLDLSRYRGDYSSYSTKARNLPTDETIVEWHGKIPSPYWQWVYGMMATYGLRNHEVFRADLSDFELLRIPPETKTGEHFAVAFPDEWIELFDLRNPPPPTIDPKRSNKSLGQATTQQFKRYKIPFSPYDLRHSWAVRTYKSGWPDNASARAMGHSTEVHSRIYQRWTKENDHREIYSRIKSKKL